MQATDEQILSKLEYIADVEIQRRQALIDVGREVWGFELSCFKLFLPEEYHHFIERAQKLQDTFSDKAKRAYDLICRSKVSVLYFPQEN
tara:strand:+ start:1150 stop:1416 length:267 start_codon:yes stop_codon:yes gene_type:complete